ncbi:MAG: hypothetical protein HKN82_16155 [Akkermansiaceae bacterium]|nr:hypothetical protein [Akkermansiaceae bacterium]
MASRITPLLAIVLAPGMLAADEARDPGRFMPAREVPDLTQTDPAGNFPMGGRYHCGPVAVSNSLWAIFGDDLQWEGVSQYDLANRLGSLGYMNTRKRTGTRVNPLMHGVQRFLRERGVRDYYLKFQGYREHERALSAGTHPPRLRWIQAALARNGSVWLSVGWYKIDPAKDEYRRITGHWVTAVGYGAGRDGEAQPDVLAIHDPGPAAGTGPSRQFIRLTPLASGTLLGASRGNACKANGIYRLGGDMYVKRGADCALLDGAAVLIIPPAAPEVSSVP